MLPATAPKPRLHVHNGLERDVGELRPQVLDPVHVLVVWDDDFAQWGIDLLAQRLQATGEVVHACAS